MWTSATSYRPNRHHNEEASDVDTPSEEDDVSWEDEEEEGEDETTVSKSYENMWKIYKLGPDVEDIAKVGHQLLNNDDTSSEEDFDLWSWGDVEEEDETRVSESCENVSELNLGTSATSHIPSWYHHRNEQDSGSSLRWRGGYELLKNDVTSSEEDDDSWDNEEEVMEWMRKHGLMSDVSNESLVGHVEDEDEDEYDVSDKLHGFVDVKEEEIVNNTEFGEVETVFPVCDWVYVTRD